MAKLFSFFNRSSAEKEQKKSDKLGQKLLKTIARHKYNDDEDEVFQLYVNMIKGGANLNITDENGNTALAYAIRHGLRDVALKLIEKGADIDIKNKNGDTLLVQAINHRQSVVAITLIEKGADINAAQSFGSGGNLLTLALDKGINDVAAALVEKGIDVNVQDKFNYTPLMQALARKQHDIACLLIEKGARTDVVNDSGYSPIVYAAMNGYVDIVDLLQEKGVSLEAALCAQKALKHAWAVDILTVYHERNLGKAKVPVVVDTVKNMMQQVIETTRQKARQLPIPRA